MSNPPVPIAFFAYARPDYLERSLECLKREQVPLVYAFCDAPRYENDQPWVDEVRARIHKIDFCDIRIIERETNFGLSKNMIDGVSTVLNEHESVIVFEEDAICSEGCYNYLCEAIHAYRNHPSVTCITGWTHPLVAPDSPDSQPYFDGRSEGSWNFCMWPSAWKGIEQTASQLYEACQREKIDIYRYGADLARMATNSRTKDIWAVRLVLLNLLRSGLCMRPPWSMIDHIGVDARGTNVRKVSKFDLQGLKHAPPIPDEWPEPIEHPDCPRLWQKACGTKPTLLKELTYRIRALGSRIVRGTPAS